MPVVGTQLHNPTTGESVVFLETAKESGGARTRFRVTIPQGKGFEVLHLHARASESFVIESGTLTYVVAGKRKTATVGEAVTLPLGVAHGHWNAHAEPLIAVQTIAPSLDIDRFLATLFGLAIDGKLDAVGQPKFLQVMCWLRSMQSTTYLAAIPVPVQDALAVFLAPVARALGYRAFYERYDKA